MNQGWEAGGVLIDLLPDGEKQKTVAGGGPANTATALSKLGIKTQFINSIPTDNYGNASKEYLKSAGILHYYLKSPGNPTFLATVTLDERGNASYEFLNNETATFDYTPEGLPNLLKLIPSILHINTLVAVIEPPAPGLNKWASVIKSMPPIVSDPNIRPSVIPDRNPYLVQVILFLRLPLL